MTLTALPPTQRTIDLVTTLRGRWHGSYAMCRCPVHDDRTPSLSIRQGTSGVLVHCFAGCHPRDVIRALRDVKVVPGDPLRHIRSRTTAGQAQRLWDNAGAVRGTLAERYLARRCLPADLADIRYHPRCAVGPQPFTAFHQTLLVAVREHARLVAVQRIVLDPLSESHSGKFLLGRCGEGAWQPPLRGRVLAIAEGFEDAAAFSCLTGIPCWAAMGAARLWRLTLPDEIDTLIIAEDNDAAGQRAGHHASRLYARPGLEILRRPPRGVHDWAEENERTHRHQLAPPCAE